GANIAPKMLTTMSKMSSSRSCRFDASPSSNLQFVRPSCLARLFPASTRLRAMSTPNTSAPSLAAGNAVVPSPHPRSKTFSAADYQLLDERLATLSHALRNASEVALLPQRSVRIHRMAPFRTDL